MGDSYTININNNGFSESFSETHRLRWNAGVKFSTIAAAIPPGTRWMVIQFIEVSAIAMSAMANTADVNAAIAILDGGQR